METSIDPESHGDTGHSRVDCSLVLVPTVLSDGLCHVSCSIQIDIASILRQSLIHSDSS
jgi:hypothetical protein